MTVVDIDPQDYFVQQNPPIQAVQPVPQVVAIQESGLTAQQLMLLAMFFTAIVALVIILYIITRSSDRRR